MTIKTNQKNFWAYNSIFDVLGNTLKPTGIAVYLCLIRHADRNAQCYPSHKLIAKKCGISRRTVVTAITKLVKLDLIKVQKRETNNGGDTSNLYMIKKLPNHIHTEKEVFPPTQEIHKEPEKIAHPPVQNLHTPCEKVAHPPVQNLHTPCENIAHEGRQTEGKLYLKDNDTKDGKPINNNTNCNTNLSLFGLNSPINISQQTVKALSKLPDNNKRQEVLDVLAASMKKGRIRKPEAYLQTLIQHCLNGDFTALKNSIPEKIDSKFIQNLDYNTSLSLEQKTEIFEKYRRQKINDCPYCDASGYINFLEENNDIHGKVCTHDKIERLPRGVVKILTAQLSYQQPGTQGLTHISELNVINSFRERFSERLADEQYDFEVPF